MGKRIIPQARGAGGPRYRSPSHRSIGKVNYLPFGNMKAKVIDIDRDAFHSAPLAIIKSEKGDKIIQIATEGMHIGDNVIYGKNIKNGNVVSVSEVPEGVNVFAIETFPGSGPKICRSSGTFATILSKTSKKVLLQFVNGKVKELNPFCRATVGIAAGGGRIDKPWVSVGHQWHAKHAKGKLYPRSAGVAMTPTDHPYGGRSKRPRPSKTVSRHASPGSKVGSIAAKRVGIRKGAAQKK